MSSILRSTKFLRCFTGITQYVGSTRQLSTSVLPKADATLERHIRRLDQDVRRIGRISRRDIEEVLSEIKVKRSASSSQSLLMIRCCGNLVPEEAPEVRTNLVKEIWHTLENLNVPMDISHYNALLRVYLENEHPFSPTDFLAELESKNIEPNRVTYQRLITRYCQQGDIQGATRILQFMHDKGLPVNESVFNALILGHSQANDIQSARDILNVMKRANLEPSADTYTTLLCCYARHGRIDDILSTLEECDKNDIFLLDKDLLEIAYELSVNNHEAHVDGVLKRLHISAGFNQDAVNVILRLVNKGFDNTGLKILRLMPRSTRSDGQLVDAGSFLIKQMVKVNRPIESILNVCKTLQNEGLNSKALLVATETGLMEGTAQNTIELLKEMKNTGLPIRQHYFWPLICSEKADILHVLRSMQSEFAMKPNSETVREYVIPHMKEKSLTKIVTVLRDAGVTNAVASSSAAYIALTDNNFGVAASIMESSRGFYSPQLFKQALITGLDKTKDYSGFIRVVRQIVDGLKYRQNVQNMDNLEAGTESRGRSDRIPSDFVGMLMFDCCNHFRQNNIECIEKILSGLVEEGLSISNDFAERISDRLGSQMTMALSEHLGKLSSGELTPVPLKSGVNRKRTPETMAVDELERFIAHVEAKGENSNNLKRHLLNACFRSKNLEKVLSVIQKFEAEEFNFSNGAWAQLIDLYTYHSKANEALALYEDIRKKNPDFVLDKLKIVRLAQLLLKEDRFDEAMEWLKKNKNETKVDGELSYNYVMTTWRILNSLAEKGDSDNLDKIFNILSEENYIKPNNIILGPLIKVHLLKNNVKKAMEVFEKISEKYQCTPWKNEIACRLIQSEDASNLQKLTDLSTSIHGEVNSLYDLVFAFIECGRIRQARKILETPGLRYRPNRIENACERYESEGLVEPLEGLVEATKDLSHIDRSSIFNSLLQSYCNKNDAQKALNLWTKMQEEDITPSDTFLVKLAGLLEKNNMKIPFVIPGIEIEKAQLNNKSNLRQKIESNPAGLNTDLKKIKQKSPQQSIITEFRKALNNQDIEKALQIKNQNIVRDDINVTDISNLIEKLVQNGRLSEATKCVDELLAKNIHPLPRIFKFFLNKIAASGDIETLEAMAEKIPNDKKKLISFDNRLCHAYIVAGKVKGYLNKLNNEINEATSTADIAKIAEKFPRGGALGILEKYPDLIEDFEKLAEKYAEKNQLGPMNVLWMHHISHGNEVASKTIWQKYLSNAPRLMFQRVLQTAREQKDHKLAQLVINQLRDSKISEGAIGNAYSCLIDIHTVNGNMQEALNTLQTAVKDVCLENINRTALQRLQVAVAEKGLEFPYAVPDKKVKSAASSSSSASSSDDDITPKKPETMPPKPKNNA